MKVFNSYGSKERLFEMFQNVNRMRLTEEILPRNKKINIIKEFIEFAKGRLNLDDIPKIQLSEDAEEAQAMHSFGKFTPELKEIHVVIANRNLADILRTIAHELVHYRQLLDNKLTSESNKTGSPDENEANAMAGVLLREFGKINPSIYE